MSEFKVQSGPIDEVIRLGGEKGRPCKYPFPTMVVGDYFTVGNGLDRTWPSVKRMVIYWNNKYGERRFGSKVTGVGLKVQRVI
jgi:hypothetical protein